MAISCEKFNQMLEIISKDHKIDMQELIGSLEKKELLPKKMMTKPSTSNDKGPYDNKRAKDFAEANGICIKNIVGTGREGRITISDMKKVGVVTASDKPKISDAATKLATENGIDISTVTPSGKRGDILLKDIKRAIEEQPAQPVVIEEDEEPVLETQTIWVKKEEDKLTGSDDEEEPDLVEIEEEPELEIEEEPELEIED